MKRQYMPYSGTPSINDFVPYNQNPLVLPDCSVVADTSYRTCVVRIANISSNYSPPGGYPAGLTWVSNITLNGFDRPNQIRMTITKTGNYFSEVYFQNVSHYYIVIYCDTIHKLVAPNESIRLTPFESGSINHQVYFSYILNGGGCLPTKNLSPRRFLKWEK